MFQFDKISVNQILVFSEIVNESSLLQKEFIKTRYLRSSSNFDETVKFLEELNLIEIKEKQIINKPKYKEFLKNLNEAEKPREMTQRFIINSFINQKTPFSGYLSEFLSQFHLTNEQYEFRPSVSERLKYSGLRNFLIDLEFVSLDSNEIRYIVSDKYFLTCAELRKSQQLSPKEFLKVQQNKEEIGRGAELKIVEYERERLSQFPHLVERIEHTALKDIASGYDIKSFDGKLNKNGDPVLRFIEVKAVSLDDYGFNWTRNEIEKAKLYKGNYYIYLLPVVGKNRFELENIRIIRDPYLNIYKNKNEWTCTEELLGFSLSGGSE